MAEEYKIQLGINFNDNELKNVKRQLTNLTDNTHRVRIDIDNSRLLKQINHAKKELRSLNDLGGAKGGSPTLNINTKSVESALNRVANSIDEIRLSLNTLDGKSGMQSLVASVNQIAAALEKANDESETLIKSLNALGKKDFSVNLGINMGKSNPIKSNQDFGRKVRNEILPELQKQVKAFEDYFAKQLNGKFRKGFSSLSPILTGSSVWQKHNTNIISVQQRMADNSNLEEQIKAYRQYLQIIKEAAMLKGFSEADINSVTSQFSQTADKLVKDAQDIKTGAKEAQEGFEKLKGIFGGASIDADALTAQLTPIVEKLEEIRVAINNLSNNDSLGGLTASFDRLSETLEQLMTNAKLVQDVLGNSFSNANINTDAVDNVEKISDASTATVVQNEKKKQEAYKATADAVVYHAGVVSRLNKAETNGRFWGSERGTGYYGTGHYFVDSATKHELDGSDSYGKLPYTSVDISKYDNLFRASTDEVAGRLHDFLKNLTLFTQGSERYDMSELFAQFKNVFGDTIMDVQEFGSRLDQLKTFMTNSSLGDRSDSVSTQFMKSLGYEGVDTRGTRYANTTYGTVIYDLKEESILQANITDELQKRGQMLEKINYANGQAFDKDADDRIQKQLDEQLKKKEIAEEFKKIYGSGDAGDAYSKLVDAQNRLQEIDGLISDYKREIDYVEDRTAKFEKKMRDFGLELSDEDIKDFQNRHIESFENSIRELQQEKVKLESEIPSLEEADRRETQLVNEAYEQARQIVEQRHLEAQQAQETANDVVQAEERKQQAIRETANVAEQADNQSSNESQQVQQTANDVVQAEERKQQAIKETERLISDSAQKAIDGVSSKSIDRAFRVDESDSNAFRREMENLVRQWTDSKGKLSDVKIGTESFYDNDTNRYIEKITRAQVTYNNELGETIKKNIALRKIGEEQTGVKYDKKTKKDVPVYEPIYGFVEVSGQYSKSLGKTKAQTDAFVKQQKQAVANLTNQINQLNRAASDQNAARPIKDSAHLDTLKTKYNEITTAIQKMEAASSDTFVDEQNNVKSLISDFKSLVSEYKNAENVSNKMKGVDFASGLDIAKNDLEKFKAEAKDFPQITKTIESLDAAISGVGDASSLNKFNDQLRVARSELAKIKSETSAANRSEKVGINVSGLESKIADLKRISPEIDKFETEIDGAKVSVQSLLNDLKRVNTQSDFSVVNSKFRSFTDAAKSAGIAVKEAVTNTKTVENIKFRLNDTGADSFKVEIKNIKDEVAQLKGVTPTLSAALRQLDAAMEAMNVADEVNDIQRLTAAYGMYEQALKKVHSQLKLSRKAERDEVGADKLEQAKRSLSLDMDNWLKDNSAAAKQFGATIRELQARIDACDDASLKNLKAEFQNVKKEAHLAGKTTKTVGDRIKEQFAQYSTYLGVAELFMWVEQGLRSMFEQVKLIDSAMTELKKVTDETDAAYNQFLSNASSRAKEIGTTIDGLVSSTADFARLGYDFEDAQGLAEVANIYAVVGDEINGVEGATESLISTMAAFKGEMDGMSNSDFAMSIIDRFNEIGNNFAISSGGIGEALERSASSLYAANNTIDESIALITAANTVVQDPTAVGTAFKTISMRIRGAKTELEDAGLETDGMVESTAKLREEIMALSGVDIMENANEFKSTYKIMDELAAKWEDLTDIQQAKCLPDNVEIH